MYTTCLLQETIPCIIVVNSGIVPLKPIGKGLYECNRTVNAGAASRMKHIRKRDEAEMIFSVRVVE